MTYKELDVVVLVHDVSASGLRAGDVGTIVHAYPDDTFEVEFVRASGTTGVVLELAASALRAANDHDQLSVRVAAETGEGTRG